MPNFKAPTATASYPFIDFDLAKKRQISSNMAILLPKEEKVPKSEVLTIPPYQPSESTYLEKNLIQIINFAC